MKRAEALEWLYLLMWQLQDSGETEGAGQVEDAIARLSVGMTNHHEAYAELLLPSGRRGHIRLVLLSPYRARVLALLVGILKSLED